MTQYQRIVLSFTLLLTVVPVLALAVIALRNRQSDSQDADPRHQRFTQLIANGDTTEAMELGKSVFCAMLHEEPNDPVLASLAKRLDVAKQIGESIRDNVRPGQASLLGEMGGMEDLGLPTPPARNINNDGELLRPAHEVYWAHLGAFTVEPSTGHVRTDPRAFSQEYCELSMQDLILEIGRHVIVIDPNSSELVCQAMVLPLLHLQGRDEAWDRMEPFLRLFQPPMLDVMSMFALLQTERPDAAMAVARHRAKVTREVFSLTTWACNAADACAANHRPDLADRILSRIAEDVNDRDASAELRLKIANAYARCGDYAEAARISEGVLGDLPHTSPYGRVMAIHLGYLAKDDNVEQVVATTASAVDDPRCGPYLGQILYLRWWALRKTNHLDEAAGIAQRLLDQYPNHSCVAPILLERATDALARQQYDRCRELLTRLTRDFAGTESAKRGSDILSRLQNSAMNERRVNGS